jgi:Lipid A 3-O-deacylase (PagL).
MLRIQIILRATLLLVSILAVVFQAPAQSKVDDVKVGDSERKIANSSRFETGMNEFGIWGSGSFNSPTLIGTTESSRIALVGIRFARVLGTRNQLTFKYTLDVIPVAFLSFPQSTFAQSSPLVPGPRRGVFGMGISPIGFQVSFRRGRQIQPFVGTSGGFIDFVKAVPDANGTRFNFAADFGGGLQIFTRLDRAITVGYKYHHLSNGNRGLVNPGFDTNLLYVGFSFFR